MVLLLFYYVEYFLLKYFYYKSYLMSRYLNFLFMETGLAGDRWFCQGADQDPGEVVSMTQIYSTSRSWTSNMSESFERARAILSVSF